MRDWPWGHTDVEGASVPSASSPGRGRPPVKADAAQTVPNTEPPGGQRTAHIEAWVPPLEDGGQHGVSLRCREAGEPGAAQPCPQTGTPAGREGLTARLARAPPRSSPRASLCPRRSTHSTALVPAQPAPPAAENATSPAAAMLTATPPPRPPGRGEASSFGYEKRVCGRSRAWRGRCHGGHAHCPLGSPRPRTTSPRRGARRGGQRRRKGCWEADCFSWSAFPTA